MDPNRYPGTSTQYSQRGNGNPPPKRPKLSIDKLSTTSNNSRSNNQNTSTLNLPKPKESNFFDDIWGEEIDEQLLKVIEHDETLAFSQMPNTQTATNSTNNAQISSTFNKANNVPHNSENRVGQVPVHNTLKGVPLRKTASSGWPTTTSAQNSSQSFYTQQNKLQTGGNNLKRGFDGKNGSGLQRPGTEQSWENRTEQIGKKLDAHLPNSNLKGVPLRRTSSSGWPSTNTFSPQPSNLLSTNATDKPRGNNTLHNDLEKLNIDNNNLKEKLNRKTGEVSVLRDKLINVQQEKSRELTKIRKELTDKMNTIKQEAESAINHLTKENKSLKSKLDVEVMEKEISVNRLNQGSPFRTKNSLRPSTSPRGRQSLPEGSVLHGQHVVETCARSSQYRLLYELISEELLQPTQPEAPISETVRTLTSDKLFSDEKLPKVSPDETQKIQTLLSSSLRQPQPQPSTSSDMFTSARDRSAVTSASVTLVSRSVCESGPTVEPCQMPSLATRLSVISPENERQVITEVVEKCSHVIWSQLRQLESTACPRNKCIEREQEVVHCSYKNLILTDDDNLLLGGKELYNNERGISARRALALLSVLAEFSEFAASQILTSSDSPNVSMLSSSQALPLAPRLLSMVKDLVHQIENQRRTLMFEGVLASSAKLVTSVLQSKQALTSQSQELLLQIVRGIVFARPGSLVLHFVLQALLAATKYPDITDNLCHNSAKKTFVENNLLSVKYFTYTPDTCMLQVLCVAVQLAETPRKLLLTDTYTWWVLTLFYSVARDPRWLFAVPSKTSCQCRPLVSRLAFHLIGEACLAYPTVSDVDKGKKRLQEVLTRGVLVVSTLLYHDEHFGVNVDSVSVGYYELFLSSMARFDIQLPQAHHDIMDTIIKQEENRTIAEPNRPNNELSSILSPFYDNPKKSGAGSVLNLLDSL